MDRSADQGDAWRAAFTLPPTAHNVTEKTLTTPDVEPPGVEPPGVEPRAVKPVEPGIESPRPYGAERAGSSIAIQASPSSMSASSPNLGTHRTKSLLQLRQFSPTLNDRRHGGLPTESSMMRWSAVRDSVGELLTGSDDSSSGSDKIEPRQPRLAAMIRKHAKLADSPLQPPPEEDSDSDSEDLENAPYENIIVADTALCCLKDTNPLRLAMGWLVNHPVFDAAILITIIISTVVMAFDSPSLRSGSLLAKIILVVYYASSAVFLLELVIKILAMGLIRSKRSYLRDSWNRLDFIIVVLSLADLAWGNLSFIKAVRALRCLRPLRVISHLPKLRLCVRALFAALPPTLHVVAVSLLFYLIFAVFGVQVFGGKFYQCEDREGHVLALDRVDCLGPNLWKNPELCHFDNVPAAFLCIFEMGTMEQWPVVLYRAVDIAGVDLGPKRMANPMACLYFVIYILICNFFVYNLLVSVVVETFTSIINKAGPASPRMWQDYRAIPPRRGCRKRVFEIVQNQVFEYFILVCILLNVVEMSLWWYGMPTEMEAALQIVSWILTIIFLVEGIFKLIGLGWQYFKDYWNVLDFIMVVSTTAVSVLEYSSYRIPSLFNPNLLRVLRAIRVLRTVKGMKGIKMLFKALVLAVPAFTSVGFLLLLIFFIYAIAGITLLGKIPLDGEFLNLHANFTTFGFTMFTLFRMCTGESWNGIMHDCLPSRFKHTDCVDSDTVVCGTYLALPYFISFVIVAQYLVLNLFIAVILNQVQALKGSEEGEERETPQSQSTRLAQLLNPHRASRHRSSGLASPSWTRGGGRVAPSPMLQWSDKKAKTQLTRAVSRSQVELQ